MARPSPYPAELRRNIERFYGDDYVTLETSPVTGTHLAAERARAVAADRIVHAEQLEQAGEEPRGRAGVATTREPNSCPATSPRSTGSPPT